MQSGHRASPDSAQPSLILTNQNLYSGPDKNTDVRCAMHDLARMTYLGTQRASDKFYSAKGLGAMGKCIWTR
jgi:hypothetical protein